MATLRTFLLVGFVLSACGGASDGAFDVIRSRQDAANYEFDFTIPDLLDGTDDGDPMVLEGTISAVDEGVGMTWTFENESGPETQVILPFGNDDAMVNSAHVTLEVEHVIIGGTDETNVGGHVRFGLAVDDEGDVKALGEGLPGQNVIVFLRRSPVFDYDEALYGVVVDGGLLCRRGESHPMECPGLQSGLAERLDVEAVTDQMLEPATG